MGLAELLDRSKRFSEEIITGFEDMARAGIIVPVKPAEAAAFMCGVILTLVDRGFIPPRGTGLGITAVAVLQTEDGWRQTHWEVKAYDEEGRNVAYEMFAPSLSEADVLFRSGLQHLDLREVSLPDRVYQRADDGWGWVSK